MAYSVNTSINNIYNTMSQPSATMKNNDSQRSLSNGEELKENIKESKEAKEKTFEEISKIMGYKIDVLV